MQKFSRLWYFFRQNTIFLITSIPVIIVDQLSKLWIKSNLAIGESTFEIGFFRLTHVRNTGSSFGLFQNQNLILSIFAIVGACIILFLVFFMHRRFQILNTFLSKLSLGLIFAGAVGNLINRLNFGYVVDFIDFNYWPAFNVADSSVVVGSILLAYHLLRLSTKEQSKNEKGG
ncbi:MAG: signal peptidase II [Dehalococcoidia bacterium]|nr:MAG: signal peptidase II [Dehalococcoidia bacterium]